MTNIGITERGDAALNTKWIDYIKKGGYAILISKDPVKLFEIIHKNLTDDECKRVIIHCTITGYAGTDLEPNVPLLDEGTFETELSSPSGISTKVAKMVLRVDPIIPTEEGLKVAEKVIDKWSYYFEEIRISFIDNYYHIQNRGVKLPWKTLHAPLNDRKWAHAEICDLLYKKLGSNWLKEHKVSVCGEPGFECNGCVSVDDLIHLGLAWDNLNNELKGQRKFCNCLANKVELLNNRHPCKHGCKYCYWKD